MPVYIDPPLWPAHGTHFSHLVSDTSYEELHDFADRLGVARRAFDRDHYDVPESLYRRAVAAGAVPVDGRQLTRLLVRSGLVVERDFGEGFKRFEPARGIPHHERWRR